MTEHDLVGSASALLHITPDQLSELWSLTPFDDATEFSYHEGLKFAVAIFELHKYNKYTKAGTI